MSKRKLYYIQTEGGIWCVVPRVRGKGYMKRPIAWTFNRVYDAISQTRAACIGWFGYGHPTNISWECDGPALEISCRSNAMGHFVADELAIRLETESEYNSDEFWRIYMAP